ncbi:MAG TPA: RusA family crossover junction endodeoxyribonuclease [Anaeromyxobacteraceae bacterium]|nr:RusA family crossover junction endodeoxyribonuclease [Anaeromyxobacteraceae bacterium]
MISFTCDAKPVSTNASYIRSKQGRLCKTPEAVAFCGRLQLAARKAMRGAKPLAGSLSVGLTFHFANERPDTDGPIKPVLDALQRIVYVNDRQVRRLVVERAIDKQRPRVEVCVVEVTP